MEWIKTSEQMPNPGTTILACVIWENNSDKKCRTVVRAQWIPKHFHRDDYVDFLGDPDYDDKEDVFYWPEGWYEWNYYEETHWRIGGKVTHWMRLPDFPEDQ